MNRVTKRRPITFTVTERDLDKAISQQEKEDRKLMRYTWAKPQVVALARHRRKGGESYAIASNTAAIIDEDSGNVKARYHACGNAAQISQLWLHDRHADIVELLPMKVTLTPIE